MSYRTVIQIGGLLSLITVIGCSSRPAAVGAVQIDPVSVGKSVIAEHDANSDGRLSLEEIGAAAPACNRLEAYDHNSDGQVDANEISQNLQRVFDGRTALLSATCRVTRNGKPIEGATVYFVPLPAFENDMPVAGGITQQNGIAQISIRPEEMPTNAPKVRGLMRPGLYFVEVTHPEIKIPEQYNVKSTLGREVTSHTVGGPIELELKF